MIGWHCNQRVVPVYSTPRMFMVRCAVCRKYFKQRKRQAKKDPA